VLLAANRSTELQIAKCKFKICSLLLQFENCIVLCGLDQSFIPMNAAFADRLEQRLCRPPPGRVAQERCAVEMSFGRHFGPPRFDARRAAVMALFYQRDDQWRLPLIVRPPESLHHANQVSLPGGAIEPGEGAQDAALRELEEELGVPRVNVRVLGALSPIYVFASNHYVEPFVGCMSGATAFDLNSVEVARLLEVPLAYLLQPENRIVTERHERGISAKAPAYPWDGEMIWGATCIILAELFAVVREAI
jgi:8-oxo-dGTP pyrophosphatase MutT (NUDIX family)